MSRIKVITVCGFGIGTSLILKMNVEKVLVENGFDVEVSPIDVTSAPSEQCDIAFTSEEISSQLVGKLKVPMIIINNFLDFNEIKEKAVPAVNELLNK